MSGEINIDTNPYHISHDSEGDVAVLDIREFDGFDLHFFATYNKENDETGCFLDKAVFYNNGESFSSFLPVKIGAKRKSVILGNKMAIINVYEMNDNFTGLQCKNFGENLSEWIDFVCKCRDGGTDYEKYDLIIGKVANDKVFRVVDMYHSGLWDKERAIKEIRAYPNYDQIAFISQKAINQILTFTSYEEV